mgnify:CR=1 FL=1
MEKNSRKNQIKHKRVGLLKGMYDNEIKKFERRNGVKPNKEQRKAIQNKVLKNVGIRVIAGVGAVFMIGSGVKRLSSGGVTIEEPKNGESVSTENTGNTGKDFRDSLVVDENEMANEEKLSKRDQLLNQVKEDIGELKSSDDVLNYMKKIYGTEYRKATGTILDNFKLICMRDGTIKAIDSETEKNIECVGYQNGKYTSIYSKDSAWYLAKEGSTVLEDLQGFILTSERIREEEVRKDNGITKQEYIDKNMKPSMVDALMKYYDAQAEKENQKSEGLEL